MRNKWKSLFFLLLGANLAVLLLFILLIRLPMEEESVPFTAERIEGVRFKVESSKKDLNEIINQYVEKENQSSPIAYRVLLDEEVELYGTMKVFTEEIDLKLTFEPAALHNGDLMLKPQTMSIGKLNLPVSYVLFFMKEQYEFPDWIYIQPQEEIVYVALQKMQLKSDFKVRVDTFDLKNDHISFALLVPTDKE